MNGKSRLQSSEIRINGSEVIITPVIPERKRIRIQQLDYTLEVDVADAETIAHSLLEHVEECRSALSERRGEVSM